MHFNLSNVSETTFSSLDLVRIFILIPTIFHVREFFDEAEDITYELKGGITIDNNRQNCSFFREMSSGEEIWTRYSNDRVEVYRTYSDLVERQVTSFSMPTLLIYEAKKSAKECQLSMDFLITLEKFGKAANNFHMILQNKLRPSNELVELPVEDRLRLSTDNKFKRTHRDNSSNTKNWQNEAEIKLDRQNSINIKKLQLTEEYKCGKCGRLNDLADEKCPACSFNNSEKVEEIKRKNDHLDRFNKKNLYARTESSEPLIDLPLQITEPRQSTPLKCSKCINQICTCNEENNALKKSATKRPDWKCRKCSKTNSSLRNSCIRSFIKRLQRTEIGKYD